MIAGTLLFAAGITLVQWQGSLMPESAAMALIVVAIVALFSPRFHLIATLLSGIAWASLQATWDLDNTLPDGWEGRDLTIVGYVDSQPSRSDKRIRFLFSVDEISDGERVIHSPRLLRLTWYGGPSDINSGDHWQLNVRLKRPHGMYNPGTFDYQGWLFQQGVGATGYVRTSDINRNHPAKSRLNLFDRVRSAIKKRLLDTLHEQRGGSLLRALVIGDRDGISREEWEVFRRTGTNHLIAISGLHIGIVSGWVFLLGRRLWGISSRLSLLIAAPRAAAVMSLVAAFFYAALSGFGIPAIRALIMLVVVLGGIIVARQVRPFHSICMALLVVLVFDPLAVLSSGFWLSFGAVAVILLGIGGRVKLPPSQFFSLLRIQWLVTLGLAPVLLALGLGISPVSPLVNLIVVPLFSLVIVPLALLAVAVLMVSIPLGEPFIRLAGWLLERTARVLEWVGQISYPMLEVPTPPLWVFIGLVGAVALVLLPRGIPGRWVALLMIIPVAGFRPQPIPFGEAELVMLDVGQGLAIVIRTRHHTMLYDTGPGYASGFNTGDAVVVPFLKHKSITILDKVVVSNGDSDHSGGLGAVNKQISVAEVISGEPQKLEIPEAQFCRAGDSWSWDGVDFHILHPVDLSDWHGNNASCVLSVTRGNGRMLITGDLEEEGERSLLKRVPEALKADLVVVPHHGSNTSSSPRFIEAVVPSVALVSSGYRNRYGFPREEVVNRWEGVGSHLLSTAGSGAISVRLKSDGGLGKVEEYRKTAKRYWMEEIEMVGDN